MTDYRFDRRTQRYRQINSDGSLGSFVSRRQVNQLVERQLESYKPELRALSKDLIGQKIGLALWETKIAAKLKIGHLQAYALGKGGIDRLTQRDYGILGSRLRDQYVYLRNFAQAIRRGELTEAQILARIDLYAEAFYPTKQAADSESHKQDGFDWYRNILAAGENCPGCQAETDKGWVAIGQLTPIGSRNCLVRCRCHYEYNSGTDKPTNSLGRHGWIGSPLQASLRQTLSSLT